MFTLDSKLESVQDADAKAKNKAYTKKYYYDGAGRLIKEKDANEIELIYEYDELGNLLKTSVKDKNSSEAKKLSSSKYNLAGEEISKTDANNVETKYEYNEFGKVKKVTYASDGSIAAYYVIYQYDTLGQLAKTISSSGVVNVYGYDILGNVISQTESDLSGGSSITKAATYDANGNKTSEIDGNGTETTYTYNKINKLVSSIVYVTDSSGKKVKHETKYDYDKNENLISETDWLGNKISYVYDSLNRVIEKKDQYNETIEKLEYNDNGTQSKSTDALGNSITYKYDGNKREIEKTDSVGTVVKTSYDYLGNVSSLTLYNGHADVTMLVNKAGDIKATYYYDAFGEVLESTGNVENSIRYAGYQYDEETGLYYLNARMYDPETSRFLQEDTYTGDKKDPLSLNLYTYCHNNPLIYDDPTGHFPHILLGGLVGGVLSVAATGVTNLVTTGKLGSAKQYVGAFASGFVEGAVGAATLGIGSIAAKVAIDAATSFGSNLIEQKITTGKVSLKKAAVETATGMAISGAASKVAKKFQNSKINQKLTKKLDDITSSLKSKTKNITTNIAEKTKEATQKAVNTVSDKAKTIANKTLKSNSLKKGIKNYFSSRKKGAVRLDVLLPEKLFEREIVENAEETITEQTLKKAQVQYDANNLEIASSISRLIPGTPGVVTGGSSIKLGENLFEYMGLKRTTKRTPYQAMHIIPKELRRHKVIKKIGMDLDDASNGIFLKNRKIGGISPMSRHEGLHKVYNIFIENKLDKLDINLSISELEKQVYKLQQKAKYLMEQGLPMYKKEGSSIDLWERWFNK